MKMTWKSGAGRSDRPYDPYATARASVWGQQHDSDLESDSEIPDRFHTALTWMPPIDQSIIWDRMVNGLRSGLIWKKYTPHLTQSGAWDAMFAPHVKLCFIIAHPEYTNEPRENVIARCRYPIEINAWLDHGSTSYAARSMGIRQSTIYDRLVRDIKREPMLRVMRDLYGRVRCTTGKLFAEKAARRLV